MPLILTDALKSQNRRRIFLWLLRGGRVTCFRMHPAGAYSLPELRRFFSCWLSAFIGRCNMTRARVQIVQFNELQIEQHLQFYGRKQ